MTKSTTSIPTSSEQVQPRVRQRARLWRGAAATVTLCLSLAGCSAPTVVEGSSVTVVTNAAFFSLNDRTSYGNSPANSSVLEAVNSSFNRYDDASNLVEDPSFGSYQLLSNDPLTVKYTIADGVTWSDGVPVDAADLLLAWAANSGSLNTKDVDDRQYRDVDSGRYTTPFPSTTVYFDGATSEGLQYVTAMPVIGDDGRSLTLTWDSYVVDWPLLLQVGLPAHVVASHALSLPLAHTKSSDSTTRPDEKFLNDADTAKRALIAAIRDHDTTALSAIANFWNSGFDLDAGQLDDSLLVSTGPYTITGFVAGKSVTLTANPRYHGDHNPVFETVKLRYLSDPLIQIAALKNAAADVVVPRASSDVLEALHSVSDISVQRVPGPTYEHLDLQFAGSMHGTFSDVRVRQAFLKVIPVDKIREKILGAVLSDDADRSSLVVIPGAPGYSDTVRSNGSAQFAHVDVQGAKDLLAQAGAVSPTVCMMFDPSNPKRVQEYQLIAESAAQAGFVVTNCSGPDWRNLLGTPGTYDASIFAWTSANLSVAGVQSIFGTGGQGNFNGFSDKSVDSMLAQLAVTPDQEKQENIKTRLDAELYAQAYGLPLYQDQLVVAHNAHVSGIKTATLAPGILWNLWEWTPVTESSGIPTPVK